MTSGRPPDLRLLLAAVGCWAAAAATRALLPATSLVRRHEASTTVMVIALAALVAVLAGVIVVGTRWGWRRIAGSIAVPLAVVCGSAAIGCLVAALPIVGTTSPPIGAWVDARATATVSGIVGSEPRTIAARPASGWSRSPMVEVRLATSRVSARGVDVDVELPLLVRLPVGASVPPPGTTVQAIGRLGQVPALSESVGALRASSIEVRVPAGVIDVVAHAMRVGLRTALIGTPPDAGSLVAGLSIGDESGQPVDLADAMRASGLSHLTAVSGGNVAIVLGATLAVATALRLSLVIRAVLALLALGFFTVLVGPQPSVLRAAAMGGIAVVGLLVGGRRAGPSVLASGVLLLVCTSPWLATAWGFALSVLATAGLILLVPWLVDRLATARGTRDWPPGWREAIAITLAAQAATLPALVVMGAAVGWVAVPANLLAMPVVPAVTVLGLLAALAAPVLPGVAELLAHAAAWPAGWIAVVARRAADLPGARLPLPSGWWGLLVLVGLGVVAVGSVVMLRRRFPSGVPRSVRAGMAAVLLASALVVAARPPARHGWPPAGWFLLMCDVGQGDALLLRVGESAAVVVDVGPDPQALDRCLTDAGITSVPAVLLTHFHADHVDGLAGLLDSREVGAVLATPIAEPVEEALDVRRLLAARGHALLPVTAGDARRVGEVAWRALWPRRRIAAGSVPNNASVVLLASVGGRRVLLTGDVEPEAQAALGPDLSGLVVDVVKVPHHGSRYQSPLLPVWVRTGVALISVGSGNDYGHPAAETVDAWTRAGALVARTDRDGDVAVVPMGAGVGVVRRGPGGLSP